ncbi:hypothetical protein Tco_0515440 [Tanacetum coccineum]
MKKQSEPQYIRATQLQAIWKSIQNGPTPHPMITDPPNYDSDAVPAPEETLILNLVNEENKLEDGYNSS